MCFSIDSVLLDVPYKFQNPYECSAYESTNSFFQTVESQVLKINRY